jgi:hypothetical protein
MIWVAFWWHFGGIIGGKLSKYSTIEKGGIRVANLGTGSFFNGQELVFLQFLKLS